VLAGRDHRQFLVQLLTRKSEEEDFKETDALYSNHQEAEKKNNLKECVFVNSALKISAMLSKIHSYRHCFFCDFAHWDRAPLLTPQYAHFVGMSKCFKTFLQRLTLTKKINAALLGPP